VGKPKPFIAWWQKCDHPNRKLFRSFALRSDRKTSLLVAKLVGCLPSIKNINGTQTTSSFYAGDFCL
jgi:hypothetical protein